ncbi:hypothetical protein Poly30_52190 [Planctomycetes bacterium Poly30]|uniref:Uncharacterized protein n=1 Tax=Saltatorellus ferox TaxID=2528018 RepID=A0A518F012_9BACT|nr:hypothetical protein Poly30_52190 [Planctomycetes bacterium Poly30]
MIALLALTLSQLAPTAPTAPVSQQDRAVAPLFRIEITRLEELTRGLLDSSAMKFWRRRPLMRSWRMETDLLGRVAIGLDGLAEFLPNRVEFVLGADSRAFAHAAARYGSVIRLVSDEEALAGEDLGEVLGTAGPAAKAEFIAMMTTFESMEAELVLDWKSEEAARRALPLVEGLIRSSGSEGGAKSTSNGLPLIQSVHDFAILLAPASLSKFIDEASSDTEVAWRSRSTVAVNQEGQRIVVRLGPNHTTPTIPVDDERVFLNAQWDLGEDLAEEIMGALLAAHGNDGSGIGQEDLDEIMASIEDSLPGRGELECSIAEDRALELILRSKPSPDAIPLHETGLLPMVPRTPAAWFASGTASWIDAFEGVVHAAGRAVARSERLPEKGVRENAARLMPTLQMRLDEARDAFGPGSLAWATTHLMNGERGDAETQPALTDGLGRASLRIDLTTLPTSMGSTAAAAGESWYFQAWHRDRTDVGVTSGLSSAVQANWQ